jgi:hypothetical protein
LTAYLIYKGSSPIGGIIAGGTLTFSPRNTGTNILLSYPSHLCYVSKEEKIKLLGLKMPLMLTKRFIKIKSIKIMIS